MCSFFRGREREKDIKNKTVVGEREREREKDRKRDRVEERGRER